MTTAAAFVVASALGAVLRAEVGRRCRPRSGFPLGTLLVNVSGAFALGLLSAVTDPVATVLGAGALGSFTTFSTFARDVVALAEPSRAATAALYLVATLALGVAAAAAGIAVAGG